MDSFVIRILSKQRDFVERLFRAYSVEYEELGDGGAPAPNISLAEGNPFAEKFAAEVAELLRNPRPGRDPEFDAAVLRYVAERKMNVHP